MSKVNNKNVPSFEVAFGEANSTNTSVKRAVRIEIVDVEPTNPNHAAQVEIRLVADRDLTDRSLTNEDLSPAERMGAEIYLDFREATVRGSQEEKLEALIKELGANRSPTLHA